MRIRELTFFIFLAFLSPEIAAQKTAKGYYLGLNNDSIVTKFKLPKGIQSTVNGNGTPQIDLSHLKDEIVVINSKGEIQRLTPAEIRTFTFTFGSKQYQLFSKPVTEYRRNFLYPQIMGRKVNLFNYTKGHPGHPIGFGHKSSSPGWKDYFWTFEKYDRTYLFLNSKMRKREIARKLKEFFKDSPQVQELIDKKLNRFMAETPNTIESIVEAYNNIE